MRQLAKLCIPFVGIILLQSIFFVTHLSAENNSADPDRDTVRIAIMQLAPYGMIDKDGAVSGYLYETANLILQTANFPAATDVLPIKRVINGLQNGGYDCSIFAETAYVKKKFPLIEKIGKKLEAGILPGAGIIVNQYQDLSDIQIALPLGINLSSQFDADKNLHKFETKGYNEAIQMLSKGRVNAVGGAIDSLRYNARKNGLDPNTIFGKPYLFFIVDIWLVCPENSLSQPVIARLRKSIISLRKSGAIQKIIDRYT